MQKLNTRPVFTGKGEVAAHESECRECGRWSVILHAHGHCPHCGADASFGWAIRNKPALVADNLGGEDFRLADDADSVWITVGDLSVYVRRVEGGARIAVYPLGEEDGDEIGVIEAYNDEGGA